jgi:hypothetical protein
MMPAGSTPPRGRRNSVLLAGGLLAALSLPADVALGPALAGGEEPSFEKQVNLVYTINNFGYIDVCG